jgi:hypothetical protein
MTPITEIAGVSPEAFVAEILPAGRPVVIRGLVGNWPAVAAARDSLGAFSAYLRRFERGYDIDTAYGAPSIKGRFFYNADLSGLNCRMGKARLGASLDYLAEHMNDDPAPSLAIQSVVINRYLPGFEQENRLPAGFVPPDTQPRLWLGSRATIAAHFDPSENIACCIAGRRRFTLFPPEQVANLYPGPFEVTPAGAVISMVDFDDPDYATYPGFRDAEAAALTADLEPGDAIYVPYLWWHHVRSLDPVNGLVNYWWASPDEMRGDPRNAMFHAMMSIRTLPPSHRDAWRAMFEHYVFEANGDPGAHLPESRRGLLGRMQPDKLAKLRNALSRALSRR